MENIQKSTWIRYIQLAIFVLISVAGIVYSLYFTSSTQRPTISNDERNWTAVSISAYEMYFKDHVRPNVKLDSWFYTYAIENGIDTAAMDIKEKQWYDFSMWTFGWKAPNMGKFIMGAYVEAAAKGEVDKNGYYEMGRLDKQEDPNIYYSRVPEDLVYDARKPNAIMNGLTIAIIFLTGWLFLNFGSGLIASLYLLLNNIYTQVNTAAGLDSPSIFFWTLAVFFLIGTIRYIFSNEKPWKLLLMALGTGIMFGFAVSSKLNAAMFGYVCMWVFPLAGIAVIWARKPENGVSFLKSVFGRRITILILSGAIIGITGVGLFIKFNPQANTSTKVKVIQLSVDEFFKRRANSQIAKNRQARKTLTDVTYKKPGKAFDLILRRNFMVDDTEKYYGTFGSLIKFKGNFLDGLFILIGLGSLLWVGFNKFRKSKKLNGEWIILISFCVMLYGMCNFIWIDFARYHMAIYPGMALVIGYGIYTLIDFFIQKVNKKKITPKTIKPSR
jgi:hypothetical protein